MKYRIFIYFLLIALSALTPNFTISAISILCLGVIMELLNRIPGPKILLFSFLYEWMQVNIKLVYADVLGEEHSTFFNYPDNVNMVSVYSNIGLIVMVIAIYIVLANSIKKWEKTISEYSFAAIHVPKLIVIYLIFCFLSSYLMNFGWAHGSLSQIIYAMASIQWGLLVVLIYIAFSNPLYKYVTFLIVGFQLLLSLASFFSSFKIFIFYFIIAYLIYIKRVTIKVAVWGIIISILLVYAGIIWTSVKGDYRSYVSGGEVTQSVNVSKGEAINKLAELSVRCIGE